MEIEAAPDPTEAAVEVAVKTVEVETTTEEVVKMVRVVPEVPDTPPHPQNLAVTAIMSTGIRLTSVFLHSPVHGRIKLLQEPEGPASLTKSNHT